MVFCEWLSDQLNEKEIVHQLIVILGGTLCQIMVNIISQPLGDSVNCFRIRNYDLTQKSAAFMIQFFCSVEIDLYFFFQQILMLFQKSFSER